MLDKEIAIMNFNLAIGGSTQILRDIIIVKNYVWDWWEGGEAQFYTGAIISILFTCS